MPSGNSNNIRQSCNSELIEIDHYGEPLIGCIDRRCRRALSTEVEVLPTERCEPLLSHLDDLASQLILQILWQIDADYFPAPADGP